MTCFKKADTLFTRAATVFAWVIYALCILLLTSCAPIKMHPAQLSYKPVKFSHPKPERFVLPNGMVLYLLEDHEVPLITIDAIIRTGGVYDPPDKVGLAQITGEVMRTGGTKHLGPDEIDRQLEYMGGVVAMDIGMESGSAYLSVMKKDFDEGLEIFSQILRNPLFAAEKIELAKMKMIESIRRQNDEPMKIASREFKRKVYRGDPRGRFPTTKGAQGITREDILRFHDVSFFPNNIIMGITGDFEKTAMIEAISKRFSDWEKREQKMPPAHVPEEHYERSVVLAEKELPQSTIIIGNLCCAKNSPDYFPMEVLNFVLGDGGFNSRLMKEIRSNRGLAYSVGSFYRGAIDYGVFGAYGMTKSDTTGLVIDLIQDQLNQVIEKGIYAEELQWAKESIINQYIFSFSSTQSLVKNYISLEYDNLPEDYLVTFTDKISMVGLEDIHAVAKKYLKTKDSVIVVLGDSRDFDKTINSYGAVEEADLSIQ